jgi:carotenoid cleavage dioxygenase-like enzyme
MNRTKVYIGTMRFRDIDNNVIGQPFKASYTDGNMIRETKLFKDKLQRIIKNEIKNGNISSAESKRIYDISITS